MKRPGIACNFIRSILAVLGVVLSGACNNRMPDLPVGTDLEAAYGQQRAAMLTQLRAYGVTNETVLQAMGKVRRHAFIPAAYRRVEDAYADMPRPIGQGQTISQPFIVAYMTGLAAVEPGTRTLEIGTGSGYQAAVLAECGADVYSVEIVPALAQHARAALDAEGYPLVQVRTGDGYQGWPEHAPFDLIILTCAPDTVPPALIEQLSEGGRLIAPVGSGFQRLILIRKQNGELLQDDDIPVRFVPMVREQLP